MARPDLFAPPRRRRARVAATLGVAAAMMALATAGSPAHAQPARTAPAPPPPPSAAPQPPPPVFGATVDPKLKAVMVPNFWNVERRVERPDAARLPKELRFVTTDDYAPFNFLNSDGILSGFNVDLARAVCAELAVTCVIQAAAFDAIPDAIGEGRADAAIAGIAATPANRATFDFSERYLGRPARFVGKAQETLDTATPETVASKKIGVVSRTAHEAYLRSFFNEAAIRTYADLKSAQEALKAGQVDLVFGDGITLALWLNGTESAGCCRFVGGPFTESRFFGDGFSVAVKEGNDTLRHAIDFALQRIWEKGVYTDTYLRWFPIGFY